MTDAPMTAIYQNNATGAMFLVFGNGKMVRMICYQTQIDYDYPALDSAMHPTALAANPDLVKIV